MVGGSQSGFVTWWEAPILGSLAGMLPVWGSLHDKDAPIWWKAPNLGSLHGGKLPFWVPWQGCSQLGAHCVTEMLPVGGRLPLWVHYMVGTSHFQPMAAVRDLTPTWGLLGGRFEDLCSFHQALLQE